MRRDPWTEMRLSFLVSFVYVLIVLFFVTRIVGSKGDKRDVRSGSVQNENSKHY